MAQKLILGWAFVLPDVYAVCLRPVKYKTIEELERHAAHDSCAFMTYFMGKVPYACQEGWAERLDDDELLYEADFEPRDHGKSELFTLAYPLRKVCKNPNLRILIVKNTKAAAIKTISVIKTNLESNERIKAFFAPHWLATVGVEDISNADSSEGQSAWGADRLYVKRTMMHQDPTIEGVGVGGAITGGHYDIIILDDAEDPARMKSDQAYTDQIDWFTGTILQLREPWTKVIVVGTFKRASGDLYEMVRSNPLWSVTIQPSILKPSLDEITYERVMTKDNRLVGVKNIKPKNVEVLCPEKWTIERLLMDREGALTPGMTDNTWRREKMNDLSAFSENVFKAKWFTNRYPLDMIEDYIDPTGVRHQFFKAIITGWDTAHTDKKANDKAAFSVGCSIGIGPNGYYLLPDFFRGQVEYPYLKRALASMYVRVRPNSVIVEYKDTGIALVQEMRKPFDFLGQRIALPLIPYDPDSDKTARAHASTPAWESGLIWLPEDCEIEHEHVGCVGEWLPGWIKRHLDFPESTFKDDVDTMSMLVNYAQRIYPFFGMKNTFGRQMAERNEDANGSRIIDMKKTLGPTGTSYYSDKRLQSRVHRLPGKKSSARSIRMLPTGRGRGQDEL